MTCAQNCYQKASAKFQDIGIDTEKVLKRLDKIALSMHCWQGDDVAGFENAGALDGGLAVTGNHPGRARNGEELRADLDFAFTLIPGPKRVNLHAIYAEPSGKKKPGRDELTADDFAPFMDWAADRKIGLDFNPTFFAHPMAASGMTLSSPDKAVRQYWIRHGIACRKIAEAFGKRLKNCCITNFWIPDGYKDIAADRMAPRKRLIESLDEIFAVKIDQKCNRDSLESKLFGIGSESYVTGSHEFYMGYAMSRGKMICLDSGHFHPTESIADKISSLMLFSDELMLHVSRGVRWDSDHAVILNDELRSIAEEVVRHQLDNKVHIGLDYFDGSINRIAAWAIGARATRIALLTAMLTPMKTIADLEKKGDFTGRLVMLEAMKTMPVQAVWNEYCRRSGVPTDGEWLELVRSYEKQILAKRK
ncbi:MAG: L-rhamnose isomerase [Lentisphaeria bacterium]|nr:L-rhamnose isomerase [Lentisphaeria bacterium]